MLNHDAEGSVLGVDHPHVPAAIGWLSVCTSHVCILT